MIETERVAAYIRSLESPGTEFLEELRKQAVADRVPIIRSETETFLRTLLCVKKPVNILEIGTAVGYSALVMNECCGSYGCHITTLENYEKRIPVALANFERAGIEMPREIELIEGDATQTLKRLTGPYDFIFMDAAKAQYIVWLPEVLRLLAGDGVLVSDNVLQDGDVLESRFAVTRRNRTIHSRMREYLFTLTHSEKLQTSVLPIGDGVAVSVLTRGNKNDV